MTDVTLRATKGSPLTHTEMDNNQVATRSGRKNMIIGGNFDTNPWQRGTQFTLQPSGTYGADRFEWLETGAGVVTVSRTANSPTVAQAGFLVDNCLNMSVTTLDASIASGDFYMHSTKMEGYDFAQIAQNDFVLSFWHSHTKTGTYCVAFKNSGSDRTFVAEYTQSVSDTYEYATVKVIASPSAGTWDYTTGTGMQVTFAAAAGTTFHTTAGAWNTGDFISTSNQVNAMDSTSNKMRFALIQIEEGIEATDFERRTIGEELTLCQRYYEKSYDISVNPATVALEGSVRLEHTGASSLQFSVPFLERKRAIPTMVFYSTSDGATGNWRNITGAANLTATVLTAGEARTTVSLGSGTANNNIAGHWAADSEL